MPSSRFVFALFFVGLCSLANARERLVLVGGSRVVVHAPAAAKFVEWTREMGGNILRINWAGEDLKPNEKPIEKLDESLFPEGLVTDAPSSLEMPKRKQEFLEKMLPKAGGVFFTGGDQNQIMDVLKDRDLLDALVARYRTGAVFGGASAGLAVMSRMMFTGEEDGTDIDPADLKLRLGLGLIKGVMLDQHFLKEKRTNRLFSAIIGGVEAVGLGVDEDSAVLVEDDRKMTVMGPKKVMLVHRLQSSSQLLIEVLSEGQVYDLKRKQVVL